MEKDVFIYLEKDYRYLNNYMRELNKMIFMSPHSAIIKGKTFAEGLSKQICKLSGYGLLYDSTQSERLERLKNQGILQPQMYELFNRVRVLCDKGNYLDIEDELEALLIIHKNIYTITCWFVKNYIDHNFEALPYQMPLPTESQSSGINVEMVLRVIKKIDNVIEEPLQDDNLESNVAEKVAINKNDNLNNTFIDLAVKDIVDGSTVFQKCLIEKLSMLKESSKEAVEGVGEFTPFKRYMHIKRDVQDELEDLIVKSSQSKKAQLILVCGSVGDGKSHVISYLNNHPDYSEIMGTFTIHNDATESLEPSKTSMDTLNEILDNFSDQKLNSSNQKFILAINLGTLNNFIDSEYGKRFSVLKEFVYHKKILDRSIEENSFNEHSSFQFVNFGDFHIFDLQDGKVQSDYIKSLIKKITNPYDNNIFYSDYKSHCNKCVNSNCCPIKANYELLCNEAVQDSIVNLLVQCIIKKKIIISTRALINFIYDLIVPRTHIDANSLALKGEISKLNNREYISSLMPNIIFNHKELSFIFGALNSLDPLNVRNQEVDDFIIEFNNSSNPLIYFEKYIDYPKQYIDKVYNVNFEETEDGYIRNELLRLFIRSYCICGKENIFSLKDQVYEKYMAGLYFWNRGDKLRLKSIYDEVKNGIMNWNGEAENDQINIFIGKNQARYKVSEDINLKADPSNLMQNTRTKINKFIGTLKLRYKSEKVVESYEIDVDFQLYKLLNQIGNGYRPNKKDKNHFINFIELISKIEEAGSQDQMLIFNEKNKDSNRKYMLKYDPEFDCYNFAEK